MAFDPFAADLNPAPFDPFAEATPTPKAPEGGMSAIANQLRAGAVVELPKMLGQAMQYTGDPGDTIYDAGKSLADSATARGQLPENAPIDESQHGMVVNGLAAGARMIPQSVVPALAVGAGLAALPASIPAAAGLLGAAALGSLPAAMSQGQQTLEKGRAAGVPEADALSAARINAGIEGLGETVGTAAMGGVLGVAGKAVGKILGSGAKTPLDVLGNAVSPKILAPWAKATAAAYPTEVLTEMGQGAGQAAVENAYGIDTTQTPLDAATSTIGPTLGMTTLLAPFGLAGHAVGARHTAQQAAALTSPDTAPALRAQIAQSISADLSGLDAAAGEQFAKNANLAIQSGQAFALDASALAAPMLLPDTGPMSAAVNLGIQSGATSLENEAKTQAAAELDATAGQQIDAIDSGLDSLAPTATTGAQSDAALPIIGQPAPEVQAPSIYTGEAPNQNDTELSIYYRAQRAAQAGATDEATLNLAETRPRIAPVAVATELQNVKAAPEANNGPAARVDMAVPQSVSQRQLADQEANLSTARAPEQGFTQEAPVFADVPSTQGETYGQEKTPEEVLNPQAPVSAGAAVASQVPDTLQAQPPVALSRPAALPRSPETVTISRAMPDAQDIQVHSTDSLGGETGSVGTHRIGKWRGKTIERLAKAFGRKKVVFFSAANDTSDGLNIGAGDTLYVNIDSGIDPLALAGHEWRHALKKSNAKAHDAIQAATAAILQGEGRMLAFAKIYHGAELGQENGGTEETKARMARLEAGEATPEDTEFLSEEFSADITGNLWRNPEAMREVFNAIMEQHPPSAARSIIQTLGDALISLINKLVMSRPDSGYGELGMSKADLLALKVEIQAAMKDSFQQNLKKRMDGARAAPAQGEVKFSPEKKAPAPEPEALASEGKPPASSPEKPKASRPTVVFEVAPDPNNEVLTAQWNALPEAKRYEISEAAAEKFVPQILERHGVAGAFVVGTGSYGEFTNPSFALELDAGSKAVDVGASAGVVFTQDGMLPVSDKAESWAVQGWQLTVELPKGADPAYIAKVYQLLHAVRLPDGSQPVQGQSTSRDGVMSVMNIPEWGGVEHAKFETEAYPLLAKALDGSGLNLLYHLDYSFYKTLSNGEDYDHARRLERSETGAEGAAGRPSAQGWRGVLQESVRSQLAEAIADASQTRHSPGRGYVGRGSGVEDSGTRGSGSGQALRLGQTSLTGVHFSKEPRSNLSGIYFGQGTKSQEAERILRSKDERIKSRIYAYVNEGKGVFPEDGVGGHAHSVNLNNLYDIKTDPLDIGVKYRNANAMESAILDAGFDGYYSKNAFGNQGVAILMGAAATKGIPAEHKGREYRGNELDVPPVGDKSSFGKLQQSVMSNRSLPGGEMTGADWKRMMPKLMPEIDVRHLQDDQRYYKDGLVKRPDAVKLSPSRQTETPEFKKWFKGSVVTKDGKPGGAPMRVYHGTNADFSEFKRTRGGEFGPGIYFSDSSREAGEYGEVSKGISFAAPSAHVMPVYVRLENPYTKGVDAFWKEFGGDTDAAGVDRAKAAGYDGVVATRPDRYYDNAAREFVDRGDVLTHYVAFDPSQVKSASGNNGAFDAKNPDIRFSPPRFFSQLASSIGQLPAKMATMPAPQWRMWISGNAAKLGIKKDEITWSGLDDYLALRGKEKVTQSEVQQFLSENGTQVKDVMLGETTGASGRLQEIANEMATAEGDHWVALHTERARLANDHITDFKPAKFGDYVVPGGENYRELLITLPPTNVTLGEWRVLRPNGISDGTYSSEAGAQRRADDIGGTISPMGSRALDGGFRSSHFEQPNILAHLRMNERTDAAGDKVLFLEELQSDWGQKGKKEGFAEKFNPADVVATTGGQPALFWYFDVPGNTLQIPKSKYPTEAAARNYILTEKTTRTGGVPVGPFVQDTKSWVALGLKRAIMYAVQNGMGKVAWATGEQNAAHYSLEKQIDSLELKDKMHTMGEPGLFLIATKDGDNVIERTVKDGAELADVIGKDAADKLMSATPKRDGSRYLTGVDLKTGGEGMKTFYDQIVPQVANDVLKKLGGGRVETVELVTAISPDDANALPTRQERAAARTEGRAGKGGAMQQMGFTITPAMAEKVSQGVPLFSTKRIIGDSGRQYTPEQQALHTQTGREVDQQTILERLKAWADKGWTQGLVDQFAPIKGLDKDAYRLMRQSKGATGAFEAFMKHGKLSLKDGTYDADTSGGVLKEVFFPLGRETTDFLYWVAGHRAERLALEGKERLFSPANIAAAKSLATGQAEFDYVLPSGQSTRDRALIYKDSLRKFNVFNTNILDMAEQSGLIDGASRHLWEHEFYVPFYRVMDDKDGGVRGMNIKQGVVRQTAFKKLKGGTEGLNDLLSNTLMNWAHLIDAGAKNRAAKASLEAATAMGAAQPVAANMAQYAAAKGAMLPPGTKGTVWYSNKGNKVEFLVEDPYLLTAINGLDYAGLRSPVMDALSKTKHWLTIGVTASPFFKVRNLIRDSVSAIGISGLGYNVANNLWTGAKLTNPDSPAYVSALAGGGLIRFGTMLEGNEAARTRQLIKKGAKDSHILDSESKVRQFYDRYVEPGVAAYNELGNRGEEINRMALYDQLIKKGVSHAEAAFQARDLMDFSMQGSFVSIRFLTQVVPFMNARLQGMYKLGRAAKEDPAKMATVLGGVTLASLGLLAAYGDDDDWKKREDWDRDNYWFFKVGGEAFRIPKPFELGAIATLAERSAELMFSDEMNGKRFAGVTSKLIMDQLSMNPVPQLVKPIIDVYSNKDSFSGRPIETLSMEKLDRDYRFTSNTSMPARAISTAGNQVSGGNFFSPVQVDHLIRGYFSWLGAFTVGAADMMTRAVGDTPAKPTMDYWKFATGGMASDLDSASSRYVSSMYDQASELEAAYGTWQQLRKEGKVDEAASYREDHLDKLRKYHQVEGAKKQVSKLNERTRMVERGSKTAGEKRAEINRINVLKDMAARRVS